MSLHNFADLMPSDQRKYTRITKPLERPLGFSMGFDPLTNEQTDVLKELLGQPPAFAG